MANTSVGEIESAVTLIATGPVFTTGGVGFCEPKVFDAESPPPPPPHAHKRVDRNKGILSLIKQFIEIPVSFISTDLNRP